MTEPEAGRPETAAPVVLIVEDSRTQAMLLRLVLEDAGFAVEAVETAQAALAFLETSLPELMITDFHLPDLRGDELCRRVRRTAHSAALPILMLSGEADPEAELSGLCAGADGYAPKGEASPALLGRVRALLRRG